MRTSTILPLTFSPYSSAWTSPFAIAVARVRVLVQLAGAAVPDDHVAAAVLAAGDHALEQLVVHRVVLDVHGEVADRRVERDALRHRPAREHAVDLEPEVVVEPPGPVALDHEPRLVRRTAAATPAGSGRAA